MFTWATHWNGSAFSTESTPNPTAPAAVKLNAVSCASSTSCIAVGQYTDTTGFDQTLAEAWNGAQWSIQATPNPSGLGDRKFNSVSCPTPTACVAVGSDDDGQLAESWNGTSWATLAMPNVPGASLSAVSCTTASACTAVGPVDGESSPLLAERWDGTTWSVESVPEPTADQRQLNAVSCASATACTAVGEFQPNHVPAPGTVHPLAAAWNGAAWTLQTVPSPANEASFTRCVVAQCPRPVSRSGSASCRLRRRRWPRAGTAPPGRLRASPTPPAAGRSAGCRARRRSSASRSAARLAVPRSSWLMSGTGRPGPPRPCQARQAPNSAC